MFMLACTLGGSPRDINEDEPVEVEVNRRDLRIGPGLTRSLHLSRWPRTLVPGFLQALMNSGITMDISVHLAPISADQAARTLEWQKVRFESARSMSFRKGRSLSPEAEIALEDVTASETTFSGAGSVSSTPPCL